LLGAENKDTQTGVLQGILKVYLHILGCSGCEWIKAKSNNIFRLPYILAEYNDTPGPHSHPKWVAMGMSSVGIKLLSFYQADGRCECRVLPDLFFSISVTGSGPMNEISPKVTPLKPIWPV